MADFYDFNSTFFLSVGTLVLSASGICLASCLKSKCSNIKLCFGCLDITRDIDAEVDIEEAAMASGVPPTDESKVETEGVPPITPRSHRLSRRDSRLTMVPSMSDVLSEGEKKSEV